MTISAVNSIDPKITAANPTLTQQIAAFTEAAEKRLPPGYIDAFRNLVAGLVENGIGQSAPKVGDVFPDFELADHTGVKVLASDHWKDRTLVIKFYRGGWCPYCNLELKALQEHSPDFADLNAELFAVAPERPDFQKETRQKAGAQFKFLWDEDSALAQKLGISFKVNATVKDIYPKLGVDLDQVNGAWILPIPATFVVKNGILKYSFIDANYLERQDPLDLIARLRAAV